MGLSSYDRWRYGGEDYRRSYRVERATVAWANGRKCQLVAWRSPLWFSPGRFDGPFPVAGDIVSLHVGRDGDIDELTIHPKVETIYTDDGPDLPFDEE